jgi:hypothetical protein
MTNIDKVSAALSEWGFKVAKDMLPQMGIPADSGIGRFMYGILGINPASYNVWNELGFLAEPLIQTLVTPAVNKMLAGIPDEQIPELAHKFADAFIQQAEKTGGVNLFGIILDKNDMQTLKAILTDKIGG